MGKRKEKKGRMEEIQTICLYPPFLYLSEQNHIRSLFPPASYPTIHLLLLLLFFSNLSVSLSLLQELQTKSRSFGVGCLKYDDDDDIDDDVQQPNKKRRGRLHRRRCDI
jgi:hypothetical protein